MDEQKKLMRDLLFSSTNMAAMTSRVNDLKDYLPRLNNAPRNARENAKLNLEVTFSLLFYQFDLRFTFTLAFMEFACPR